MTDKQWNFILEQVNKVRFLKTPNRWVNPQPENKDNDRKPNDTDRT